MISRDLQAFARRWCSWFSRCLAAWIGVSALTFAARAQDTTAEDAAAGAAGCAACGAVGMVAMVIPLAILALNIWMVIWVGRDAKARGMDNAVLWMVVTFFASVIGLAIYLSQRPKGDLVPCAHCGKKRLPGLATCPNCGQP